jgi:hypothetical protein
MQVSSFLYQQGNHWVFNLAPLAGSNATPNVLRAFAKAAQRLGSLNVMGDIKMFDGNELDQATGFWLQQAASGFERLVQAGSLNLLAQQVKVKSVRFHALYASDESVFQLCQQDLAVVLDQPTTPRPASNPQLVAQRPSSNPQQAVAQKPNPKPQQQGASMSNQNIPLVTNEGNQRHIYHYYVFNIDTDEIVKEGSIIVPGQSQEEAMRNLTDRIKSTLGVPLTSDMYLKVRWVTSFDKPKKELDPNAKLAEAIKAVMGK